MSDEKASGHVSEVQVLLGLKPASFTTENRGSAF